MWTSNNLRTNNVATNEEKRFAIGLLGMVVIVTLMVLAFRFIGDDSTEDADEARRAPVVSEADLGNDSVTVLAASPEAAPEDGGADSPSEVGRSQDSTAQQMDADDINESDSVDSDGVESDNAVAVIDPVPLAYFEQSANPVGLPAVIDKYIERVERGTRFMARLEDIVADAESVIDPANDTALGLRLSRQSISKRLSFNVTHETAWLEAEFDSGAGPGTADVLVDIRSDAGEGQVGERVALFFASVQDREGALHFALEAESAENAVQLRVYELTDALPLLGSATVAPEAIAE